MKTIFSNNDNNLIYLISNFIRMITNVPIFFVPIMSDVDRGHHRESPANETAALKHLIRSISAFPPKIYSTNELSQQYNCKRRGMFDFLCVGNIFQVCRKISNENFEWLGYHNVKNVLISIAQSQDVHSKSSVIEDVFDCVNTSSLSNLAFCVVKLFFFLNTECLDIRQISKLFSRNGAKYKAMLRKLYTVITGLELCEIVSRTNNVAEIKFRYPLSSFYEKKDTNLLSINSMLNTTEDLEEENMFKARRSKFNNLTYDPRYNTYRFTSSVSPIHSLVA